WSGCGPRHKSSALLTKNLPLPCSTGTALVLLYGKNQFSADSFPLTAPKKLRKAWSSLSKLTGPPPMAGLPLALRRNSSSRKRDANLSPASPPNNSWWLAKNTTPRLVHFRKPVTSNHIRMLITPAYTTTAQACHKEESLAEGWS